MNDHARRKELTSQYKQNRPEAGVYRIVNARNGRYLIGSAMNLASVQGRVSFAVSTESECSFDPRLRDDARVFGFGAFSVEVLEILESRPEATDAEVREDLAALESLWRERFDPEASY